MTSMVGDVVKDYLVSLGYKVNKTEYAEFAGSIKKLDNLTTGLTSNLAKTVTSASVVVTGFLASVVGGVAGFLDGIAQADMDTEKFAKRMWMTEEAARSLEIVLNAMGEDLHSMEDVAMNEELRKYFFALRKEGERLLPPKELQEKLQGIREIRFEFMRFRQIVSYGAQWVSFYLTKYLDEPLGGIKSKLGEMNDFLVKNLPEIANKVAKGLMVVLKLAESLVWAIGGIVRAIKDVWDSISPQNKETAGKVGIIGALFTLLKLSNPLMIAITAITTGLFLLQDLFKAFRGEDSLLGEVWDPFIKVFGDKELIVAFEDALIAMLETIGSVFEIFKAIDDLVRDITGTGLLEGFLYLVKYLLVGILQLIEQIHGWINAILGPISGIIEKISGFKFPSWGGNPEGFTPWGDFGAGPNFVGYLPGIDKTQAEERAITGQKQIEPSQLSPTYNIYGSDPKETAREANKYNESLLIRSLRR